MFKKNVKRCLAVLLTVMMLISSVPTGAFATEVITETEEHNHNHVNEELMDIAGDVLSEMEEESEDPDASETEKTEVEIEDTVTDEAVNATYTPIENISVEVSASSESLSNGTLTVTAKGSMFSKKTSTVTINNTSGSTINLSFDYSASNANSFTINGASAAASGSFSGSIDASASVTIKLISNSGLSNLTATLKLSNFVATVAKTESNVTIAYDSSLGSVNLNGEAVSSGSVYVVTLADGATLEAVASADVKFYGWVDETGKVLSTDATYAFNPSDDITVKALFGKEGGTAIWAAGGASEKSVSTGLLGLSKLYYKAVIPTHLFEDLNAAAAYASSSSSKYIVLMNNGTLPAGTYTIPSGVTLLVPFDSENSLFTTDVLNTGTYATPTAYRTLTLADGANLIVNGALSLSAKQKYAAGSKVDGGAPTGPVSFVNMEGSSNITINNGGALYAYGFITGSGSVTANSGSKVYEMFQITDFRGGTQSTDMDNKVFPLSQYYVQNIEVPLTLYAGATEYSYTTIYMSNTDFASSVAFIGSSGSMFNLTSGHVVKWYDGNTDRLMVEAHGDLTVSPITMGVGTSSINSKDFVLGINGNITVDVKSGTMTLGQNLAFLPGSEIIIGEDATCSIGKDVSVYVYDLEQWGNYCGSTDKRFIPVIYAPGQKHIRTDADLKDAKVLIKGEVIPSGGYFYTTESGADIGGVEGAKVSIKTIGSETVTYQLRQTAKTYDPIPITPAKLKNADGTYVIANKPGTYTYAEGVWVYVCTHLNDGTVPQKDPTCTEPGNKPGVICPDCGEVLTNPEPIAPTGHNIEIDAAVPATCTTTGLTEGQHCTNANCDGSADVAQVVIEALGHTYVGDYVTEKEATCTTSGLKVKVCTVCGYRDEVVIGALGHDHTIVTVDPTCTTMGSITKTCQRAGCPEPVIVENLALIPHEMVVDPEIPATCLTEGREEGKHCANCDRQTTIGDVIPVLEHSYTKEDTSKRVEATCTEAGSKVMVCVNGCNGTKKETIPAHNTEVMPAKDPTCVVDGYTSYVYCNDCQKVVSGKDVIPATGIHTIITLNGKAATCTEDGLTEGKECSVCDYVEVEQVVIPKTNHADAVTTAGYPATCTEVGMTDEIYCYDCDTVLQEAEEIPKLDHDYSGKGTVVTEPTCTSEGYTTKTCQRKGCGYSYVDEASYTDALGHDWNEEVTKAATCTETGVLTKTCKRTNCGAQITATIPVLNHDFKEVITAPTCEDKGYTTYICQRENCAYSYVDEDSYVDALKHDYDEGVVTTAPTCTTPGVLTRSCKRDGCESQITEAISKLGHDFDGAGTVVTAPTCTEDGYTTYDCQRENCDYGYVETNEDSALGHEWNAGVENKAPTCKDEGETTFTCQRENCGETKKEAIATVGHKYAEEGVVALAPTCETEGEKRYYCEYECGNYETEVISKLGHDFDGAGTVVTAPTCTEDGYTTYDCQRENCDYGYVETNEDSALGHEWNAGVENKAPTCKDEGETTFTCQRENCGETKKEAIATVDHKYAEEGVVALAPTCETEGEKRYYCVYECGNYETEVITKLGHNFDGEAAKVVTAPTCEDKGYTTYYCQRENCTYSYVDEDSYTDALKHDYDEGVETKAPTCTTPGVLTKSCKRDGCDSKITEAIPALEHNYTSTITKAPTCTETGLEVFTCTRGDDEYEVVLDALGHDMVHDALVEPTCTTEGEKASSHCSRCEYTEGGGVIPALGHDYVNGTTVVPPTCTEEGYTLYECQREDCGESHKADFVAKLDHDIVFVKYITEPTCTVDGLELYECNNCDYAEEKVVTAEGHDYDEGVVTAPTCTAEGFTTYTCSVCGDSYIADVVDALGHDYEAVVTAPTCTAEGFTTYTCSVCGDSYTADVVAALGHDYEAVVTAPDCENDGFTTYTCSVCGDTYIADVVDALGHDYEAVVTAPNCENDGFTTYTCSVCGNSYTADVVAAFGHNYEVKTIAPTCVTEGYNTNHCLRCNNFFTSDFVAKLGHDIVIEEAIAPTCTEEGFTQGQYCTRCDDETIPQIVIDALGHDYDEGVITLEPTCTEAGKKLITCKNGCGDKYSETVPSKGHTYEAVVTAPDCENDGFTTYTCSACGDSYTADVVDALGHDYEAVVTAPDCENEGFTTYTCLVCGDSYTADVVDALGHNYVGEVTKAPTCEDTGIRKYTCANGCGSYYTEAISALGHSYESVVTAPDCENDGFTTYTCTVCGSSYTADVVPAFGHSYEAVVTAPTCTTRGFTTHTCSACGDSYQNSYVAALRHDIITDAAVAPTCTETGLTAGRHCSRCDDMTVAQEVVSALGHDIIIDSAKAPTCIDEGLTEGQHCSRCNDATVAQDIVSALGHDIIIDEAKAPTCIDEGLTEGQHCSRCNDATVNQEVVNALGHDEIILEAVEATCETTGLTEGKQCTRCGVVTVKQKVINALGHTYIKDNYVAPTCETTGLSEGNHCDRCGKVHVAQNEIPALGHDKVTDKAVAPTCEATGLTEGWHCSRCDAKEIQVEIPALGHSYIGVVTAPTCVRDGFTTFTCETCGSWYRGDSVKAPGHVEVIDEKIDATCTSTGLTEGKHCSVCETVLVFQVVIPVKAHTEALLEAVDPTCLETGLTEGSICAVCGTVLVAQDEIPALGHELKQYESKLPSYTAAGWEAYEACERCDYSTKVEIPALGEPSIEDYATFMENLILLENLAKEFARANPGNDPLMLVIKYIRTGVDRYNSGSWGIMAGYENAAFAQYVTETEARYNETVSSTDDMLKITGLKNIENFKLLNGDNVDFGHMFGTMDITYHNKGSENHADVGGWAGDLVDLLSSADRHNVSGTLDEMIADISKNYLGADIQESDVFNNNDLLGDLDGYYIMNELYKSEYECGDLHKLFESYFTSELSLVYRADYFLKNRLGGTTTRDNTRNAVYDAYIANKVVTTLENTREFVNDDLTDLRKASCYAFADFLCKLAGDYVDHVENKYYTVFSTEKSNLAPGITQEIKKAYTADDKQIVYYIATADINSEYVDVYANYKNNDPTSWGMSRVLDQANAAQNKYGNPESPNYIENYNVIASINGDGYNMETGEPGGLLVMGGVEYHPVDAGGFFGITKDGKAVIGTMAEYKAMKDEIAEGVGGFGTTLIRDGKISITATSNYYVDRASRTAVGITKTGKVVFMVLDGRQEPVSCGGSMQEIAQIMLDAGCIDAVNLDGGGSTTYVAREEGASELAVVSKPSDGYARSVSTSLMMVSTAPSSTEFDHAVIDSDKNYLTIGSSVQLTASGVSAMGNSVEVPADAAWAVSDENIGTVNADGVFTAKANGTVSVYLMLDGEIVGEKKLNVVIPDTVYFKRDSMDAVYGETITLPVAALYEGKEVAITENDVTLVLANSEAGIVEGFDFTGNEASGIKNVVVTAVLNADENINGIITLALYKPGEATFDFDKAMGGDRQFAWDRDVSNSTTTDNIFYNIVDPAEDMVTSYTFAIDMTQIPIPEQLADLTTMLPGADAEDACAWNFLLQLAERISVLTTVSPEITFDKNFDVDYSDLTIVNEYFQLQKTDFDEETNTLKLTLRWIDQTQAIDPTMANPICILSGIKVTPKADAEWDTKEKLSPIHTGKVSYEIYMRANALYTFAQKVENQQVYGVYPFVNPDDANEKGGYFGSIYCEFSDNYTLVKSLKSGWVNEDGGYAYYENGDKLYGVQMVEGLYYDFGENGINLGKTPYTGLFAIDGVNYYAKFGKLASGWAIINDKKYCFDKNGKAYDGKAVVDEVEYEFDNGLLIGGYTGLVPKSNGKTYYYIDGEMQYNWHKIGDYWYHFHDEDGWMFTGYHQFTDDKSTYYDFADDGRPYTAASEAPVTTTGQAAPLLMHGYRSVLIPTPGTGTNGSGHFVTDLTSNPTVRIMFDGVIYTFDNTNGKLLKGNFLSENGNLYYYWAGKPVNDGWFEFEDNTYYAFEDGHLATGTQIIDGEEYLFSKTGALIEKTEEPEKPEIKTVPMFRLYNPNSGEHFYTGSTEERALLVNAGWHYEGVAFNAPVVGAPVYRVYNPNSGDHHYTMSKAELDMLVNAGWNYEGVAWNSAPDTEVPQYRLWNPNADLGSHHYTGSLEERRILLEAGWVDEGIGWYSSYR